MAKRVLSLLLSCCTALLLAVPASAHTHPGDSAPLYNTSSWAQEEVVQAAELGLIPYAFEDYTVPITRLQFTEFAIQYLARQERSSPEALKGMALQTSDVLMQNNSKPIFSDVQGSVEQSPEAETVLAAYSLDLAKGRGNGSFAPEAPITRQEAATLLLNTYKALGGSAVEESDLSRFTDADDIPSYALEGVNTMVALSVMNGTGEDTFSPKGNYTVEQCAVTFLHLWKNAPVSQEKGNVSPRFTYKQASAYVKSLVRTDQSSTGYREAARWTGPEADLVRLDWGGSMHAHSVFYLIRHNGSVEELDLGICYDGTLFPASCTLEDAGFSEDGDLFTCSVTVGETMRRENAVLHAAGTYHISIDVATGVVSLS